MSYEWRTPEYLTMLHSGSWKDTRGSQNDPRINWTDIVKRNLKNMDITWEEAKELAADRTEWRQQDVGWTEQNRTEQQNSIFYFVF